MRARSAELGARLRADGVVTRVRPVVVLWADFDGGPLESDVVALVRGCDLATFVERRPPKLGDDLIEHATRSLGGAERPAPTAAVSL